MGVLENGESTSRIILDERDAAAFPKMLDFLYSGTLDVSTIGDALSLRSLASYFQCQALKRAVNTFVQHDLTEMTAVAYLHHAFERNDEYLENASRRLILENYTKINKRAFQELPLELFRSVVCSPELDTKQHKFASVNICQFLRNNMPLLSAVLVNDLTKNLSEISPTVAANMMDLVCQLDPSKEDRESMLALDALCAKCAEGIACQPGGIDADQCVQSFYNPRVEGDYRGSGRCAVSILAAALKKAQAETTDYAELKERVSKLESDNARLRNGQPLRNHGDIKRNFGGDSGWY